MAAISSGLSLPLSAVTCVCILGPQESRVSGKGKSVVKLSFLASLAYFSFNKTLQILFLSLSYELRKISKNRLHQEIKGANRLSFMPQSLCGMVCE